jgi:hypothetical protein
VLDYTRTTDIDCSDARGGRDISLPCWRSFNNGAKQVTLTGAGTPTVIHVLAL